MKIQGNPYYSPELSGLEIINSFDIGKSYEFNKLLIWKNLEDNTLWYGTDSGCSCPTPFDNFDESCMTKIESHSLSYFESDLKGYTYGSELQDTMVEIRNLLNS